MTIRTHTHSKTTTDSTTSFKEEDYSVSNRPSYVNTILLRTTSKYSRKPTVDEMVTDFGSPVALQYPIECLKVFCAADIGLKKRINESSYASLTNNHYVLGYVQSKTCNISLTEESFTSINKLRANDHS